MSMNVGGGPALPVTAVSGAPQGNVARPVHTYHTKPTDRAITAVPVAQPVVYITAGQLKQNGGTYYLEGDPVAMPVYDGHSLNVGAGAPLPVYEA